MYVLVSYLSTPRTPASLSSRFRSIPSAPANESPICKTVVPLGSAPTGASADDSSAVAAASWGAPSALLAVADAAGRAGSASGDRTRAPAGAAAASGGAGMETVGGAPPHATRNSADAATRALLVIVEQSMSRSALDREDAQQLGAPRKQE